MDYDKIGLTNRLQSKTSLLAKRKTITGPQFDSEYEIQTNKVKISGLVQNSDTDSATGSFNNGESVTVTTTIQGKDGQPAFGHPFIAIFTGTAEVSANQLYPRFGAGIANDKYSIHSGFDYRAWNGKDETFRINIENNSGTATSLYAIAKWKKLVFTGGQEQYSTS